MAAAKCPLRWLRVPAHRHVAALTVGGDYVISHRPREYTVSYRPPGGHHHVGEFKTVQAAKKAAVKHCRVLAASRKLR